MAGNLLTEWAKLRSVNRCYFKELETLNASYFHEFGVSFGGEETRH